MSQHPGRYDRDRVYTREFETALEHVGYSERPGDWSARGSVASRKEQRRASEEAADQPDLLIPEILQLFSAWSL